MRGADTGVSRMCRKHFQDRFVELQIPPLRFATVGITKGKFGFTDDSCYWDVQIPFSAFHKNAPLSPLSSRPERSAVEGSAVFSTFLCND
jgi:hypothetical protein